MKFFNVILNIFRRWISQIAKGENTSPGISRYNSTSLNILANSNRQTHKPKNTFRNYQIYDEAVVADECYDNYADCEEEYHDHESYYDDDDYDDGYDDGDCDCNCYDNNSYEDCYQDNDCYDNCHHDSDYDYREYDE